MNNQQREFNQERFRKDWLANKLVTATGWLVLATFILIIWHIFSHAFPLFKSPELVLQNTQSASESAHFDKVLELSNGLHVMGTDNCDLVLFEASAASSMKEKKRFPFSCDHQFVFPEQSQSTYIGVVTSNELFELYKLRFNQNQYELTLESSISISEAMRDRFGSIDGKVDELSNSASFRLSIENDFVMLAAQNSVQPQATLHTYWFSKVHPDAYIYNAYNEVSTYALLPRSKQIVTFGESIWLLSDSAKKVIDRQLLANPVSSILVSPSQRSLYSVDANNTLTKWLMINEEGRFLFKPNVDDATRLEASLNAITFDPNSNAALLLFDNEKYAFMNRVTNEVFRLRNMAAEINNGFWYGSRFLGLANNKLHTSTLQNLQGITTVESLLSEVWYEGYDSAEYVWQTSSAAPNYEAKMSLMPLIIGSLKASFLALFVAIPLALGAAVYTSFFADPAVRNYIKPAIEMLEAVPSVVIGFIAAVWLVPIAEAFLLSVILFIVLLPVVLIASAMLQPKIATLLNSRLTHKWELLFIILGVLLLGVFCFSLSDLWRFVVLSGGESGIENGQLLNISKTTIVVAIALGVAISPSIYSLAEDALFEVPEGIKQASYALGATKLQTLRSVIIAVAFPSILSAVMLGFGRAFGETMIVLMVTGNTAISDWSILEGLRSMTANLAIELSEASSGSSHFNTLFLTAGILFIFTFIVNTAAEILRKRLRLLYHYD